MTSTIQFYTIFALFVLGFSIQSVQAQQAHYIDFTRTFESQKIIGNGVFSEAAPSLETIQKDLEKFKSSEEFLDYLIKAKPSLKSDFVILHHSQSLQNASPQSPRIILFGGGAAYAFSDDLNKKNKVEMLYADPQTYQISLAEIEFQNGQSNLHVNPQVCLTCHGSPAKPLWNPYDFWPNAIGSSIGIVSSEQEKEIYNKLFQTKETSPILSRLNLSSAFDFNSEDITAFTQYISIINMGRWINQSIKNDDANFKKYFLLLGQVLSSCHFQNNLQVPPLGLQNLDYLNQYFDLSDLSQQKDLYVKIESDVSQSRQFFKRSLDHDFNEFFPNPQYLMKIDHARLQSEVQTLAQIQWILALANINSGNLTSSLVYNDYLITTPSFWPIEFLTSLYELRPELFTDVQLETLDLGSGQKRWIRFKCDQVFKTNKILVPEKPADLFWSSYQDDKKIQPVISRCSRCHSSLERDVDTVPFIPFDNPDRLADLLKSTQGQYFKKIMERVTQPSQSDDLMPPDQRLSEDQIRAFETYLTLLTQ